eukprot:SAG11_NODE_5529_length_1534_cov_1.096864_2_plen_201_part_00
MLVVDDSKNHGLNQDRFASIAQKLQSLRVRFMRKFCHRGRGLVILSMLAACYFYWEANRAPRVVVASPVAAGVVGMVPDGMFPDRGRNALLETEIQSSKLRTGQEGAPPCALIRPGMIADSAGVFNPDGTADIISVQIGDIAATSGLWCPEDHSCGGCWHPPRSKRPGADAPRVLPPRRGVSLVPRGLNRHEIRCVGEPR